MINKPNRVRVLMIPSKDDDDNDPAGYAGPATVLTGLPRTIGGMNSDSSCRSLTARSTKWKSEATSLAASISRRDAWCGTWKRSRHGCSSAAKPISQAKQRSRPARMFANARPAP